MSGDGWVPVIAEHALRAESSKVVFPRGIAVLLIRTAADELFAVSNRCAHMSCPLRDGQLDGYILTCPCHDWRFDIRTGQFLDAAEITIPVYQTRIDAGFVCVKI